MANLLNLRDQPASVTSYTLAQDAKASTTDDGVTLSGVWGALHVEALTPEEKQLVAALAAAELSAPELGHEATDGLPLEVSWPDRRIAVDFDLTDTDREALVLDGWTLVDADVDAIKNALADVGGS
jgi:hypothetical protein